MNLDWKKIGIIAMFIAAVLLFGFFLYFFFFRPIFRPQPTANVNITNGQLPPAVNANAPRNFVNVNGQLVPVANANVAQPPPPSEIAQGGPTIVSPITKDPAYFPSPTADGRVIYYNPKDGKFYRVTADGQIEAYNDKVFYNVSNATWSKDHNMAVLEYPDGSNIIYDFKNNKQYTLPAHWQEFSFAPDSQQIAFKSMALDPENRFLALAKYDSSQVKILEDIGGSEDKFQINFSPSGQVVGDFKEGKDLDRSEIYFIGQNKENFKSMVVEGRDFRGLWSPTGNRMVYSVYNSNNGYLPELWISDASGDNIGNNRQKIYLNTWADKCSFAGNSLLYCAVPQSLPEGAGLVPEAAADIADNIYEINLSSGARRMIATPSGDHNISQIITIPNANYILFSDSKSKMIYRMDLQ